MIKAVCYGMGAMGKIMARFMLEKGVCIVGAIDVNPAIIGKDLGEVIGLDHELNVPVSDDADEVLSTCQADIAVLALMSEVEPMAPFIEKCIRNGMNVITTSRECAYPYGVAPVTAARLDKLAREYGVSISASGTSDVFMVNQVTQLAGTMHKLESIDLWSHYDVNDYGAQVALDMMVGKTVEEVEETLKTQGIVPSYVRLCLEAIIYDMGLSVKSISQRTVPRTEDVDLECAAVGTVKAGYVTGLVELVEIETEQGIRFTGEWSGRIYKPGETNKCIATLKGVPEVYTVNDGLSTNLETAAQMVNRIPDVINAAPGYRIYTELPPLKYRAFPLSYYVK